MLAVSTWGKLGAALLMLGTAARLARAAATGICSFIARARAGVLQADQKIETSVCTADWQVCFCNICVNSRRIFLWFLGMFYKQLPLIDFLAFPLTCTRKV